MNKKDEKYQERLEMKKEYNKLLAQYNEAEKYFNDDSISNFEKTGWIKKFKEISDTVAEKAKELIDIGEVKGGDPELSDGFRILEQSSIL